MIYHVNMYIMYHPIFRGFRQLFEGHPDVSGGGGWLISRYDRYGYGWKISLRFRGEPTSQRTLLVLLVVATMNSSYM